MNDKKAKQRLNEIFNGTIKPLTSYCGPAKRMRWSVECICGNRWSPLAYLLFRGSGCKKCSPNYTSEMRRRTGQMNALHFQLPDDVAEARVLAACKGITLLEPYPGNRRKPWLVQCQCGHKWKQQALALFRGVNCPKCCPKKPRKTQERALLQLREAFSGTITPLEPYQQAKRKWLVECSCGYKWRAFPFQLFRGSGCPKCRDKKLASLFRHTNTQAVAKLKAASKGKITPLGPYLGNKMRWSVQCQCGHKWKPRAGKLFRGQGCPKCAEYGFQPAKPGIVYYIRISGRFGKLYKIGVTNRTVGERFERESLEITVLEIWSFKNGHEALELEARILNENGAYKYVGPQVMKSNSNDELFTRDVLGLDAPGQLELFTTPEADSGRPTSKAA